MNLEDVWKRGADSVRKKGEPPEVLIVTEDERHDLMKQAQNFEDPWTISNVSEWPNRFTLFEILITTDDRERERKARRRDTGGALVINEKDLPRLELSFIETCQSAAKLVNIGTALGRVPIVRLIAAMPQVVCPCREHERQKTLIVVNADYMETDASKHKVLTVEVKLKKFYFSIPQLRLAVSGACALCPNCQTLYYAHF